MATAKATWKNYTMVLLSVALLASLGLDVQPEPTHYCDDRQLVAHCYDLSSTKRTCYTLPAKQAGKLCGAAWQLIPNEVIEIREFKNVTELVNVVAYTDNGKYFCDKVGIDANCVKDDTLEMPFG